MNEDEKMGDDENVGIEVEKEVAKKEKEMRTMRRLRGWSCHLIVEKTMSSCPMQPEWVQKRNMILVK